jgi:hypothetical protein
LYLLSKMRQMQFRGRVCCFKGEKNRFRYGRGNGRRKILRWSDRSWQRQNNGSMLGGVSYCPDRSKLTRTLHYILRVRKSSP